MFAKLKQKLVEVEGESPLNRSFGSPGGKGPGQARNTSGRRESLQGRDSDNDTASGSSSQIPIATKEELIAKIAKKSEQIRDLEAKVSEYGAMLKDTMKMKDKVEAALEKQQDATLKRIQEMNEEYQSKRSKMSEAHALALKIQEEEFQTKQENLQRENTELREKVSKLEGDVFKKREENDEIQEFQIQEMAKVKHLFLNSQEELGKCKDKLKETSQKLEDSLQLQDRLQTELETNKRLLEKVTKERDDFRQNRLENADLVLKLEREKTNCVEKITELNQVIAEKSSSLSKLEIRLNSIQDEYDSLRHSNDVYRQQIATQLEERESTVNHLQEKVRTLEQRLQDNNLSGDDKLEAVKSERDQLELKLEESRQHLNDVKSTWSSKINSLEQQISHLNAKIGEDSDELETSRQTTQSMKEKFEKQVDDLKSQLTAAEDRAFKTLETMNDKESKFDVQKAQLEVELQKSRKQIEEAKQQASESRQHLQDKINALESQILALETAKELDKNTAQQRISLLENTQTEYLEKEIEHEKHMTRMEEEGQRLKEQLRQKDAMYIELAKTLEDTRTRAADFESETAAEIPALTAQLEDVQQEMANVTSQLEDSNKENEQLRGKNKRLMSEIESLLERSESVHSEAQKLQLAKAEMLEQLQRKLRDTEMELEQCYEKIRESEEKGKIEHIQRSTSIHDGELDDSEVAQLRKMVDELMDQVAEKNKTIKMQQQRLSDLKKTLQRELKVQTNSDIDGLDSRDKDKDTIPRSSTVPQSLNQSQPSSLLPPGHGHTISPMKIDELRETNFQYLRYVIFKFMCSSDTEAFQLVRAISTLLHFTKQEERLVKETIEWKMSWFGSKPTPARPLNMTYR
ncbi:golgin subfamily A member 1-like isoform X1 [Ptychodera flava]|uniref:golgin subfamily A member 1-like isoform X1 n=1 Tax=Ptychodera flava TaxID=63121 RepID=UPI00396A047C